MSVLFQTVRPGRELGAKASFLLQKWNKFSNKKRENIVKEVFGDCSKQPNAQVKAELKKAITNADCDRA